MCPWFGRGALRGPSIGSPNVIPIDDGARGRTLAEVILTVFTRIDDEQNLAIQAIRGKRSAAGVPGVLNRFDVERERGLDRDAARVRLRGGIDR